MVSVVIQLVDLLSVSGACSGGSFPSETKVSAPRAIRAAVTNVDLFPDCVDSSGTSPSSSTCLLLGNPVADVDLFLDLVDPSEASPGTTDLLLGTTSSNSKSLAGASILRWYLSRDHASREM